MISFIIIGKNEGWRLTKCFENIRNVVNEDSITDFEIIYIDSRSTDDSLQRASQFSEVKSFLITGECNAAIARNIRAKEAKGSILFFIDGDMEIQKGFLPKVLDSNGNLFYPFVSGNYEDCYYDKNDILLNRSFRSYCKDKDQEDRYYSTTGGFFIIEKQLWNNIGDNRNLKF